MVHLDRTEFNDHMHDAVNGLQKSWIYKLQPDQQSALVYRPTQTPHGISHNVADHIYITTINGGVNDEIRLILKAPITDQMIRTDYFPRQELQSERHQALYTILKAIKASAHFK